MSVSVPCLDPTCFSELEAYPHPAQDEAAGQDPAGNPLVFLGGERTYPPGTYVRFALRDPQTSVLYAVKAFVHWVSPGDSAGQPPGMAVRVMKLQRITDEKTTTPVPPPTAPAATTASATPQTPP
jgi:hypothetical protein